MVESTEIFSNTFAAWVADILTDHIASTGMPDFVLKQEGNTIVYVDVEDTTVYVLTVEEVEFV